MLWREVLVQNPESCMGETCWALSFRKKAPGIRRCPLRRADLHQKNMANQPENLLNRAELAVYTPISPWETQTGAVRQRHWSHSIGRVKFANNWCVTRRNPCCTGLIWQTRILI